MRPRMLVPFVSRRGSAVHDIAARMVRVAPIRTAPPAGHTTGIAQTRSALGKIRPGLLERYDAAVPAARAAVLARLLGALDREPLPGIASRARDGGVRHVTLADGRTVSFPAAAGRPFAEAEPGLAARVDRGVPGGTPGPATSTGGAAGLPGVAGWTDGTPGPNPGGPETGSYHDPGDLVRALWPRAGLAAEIDNSVANLALARAGRPVARRLAAAAVRPPVAGRAPPRRISLARRRRRDRAGAAADVAAYGRPDRRRRPRQDG